MKLRGLKLREQIAPSFEHWLPSRLMGASPLNEYQISPMHTYMFALNM
jgi:hypothetical protein